MAFFNLITIGEQTSTNEILTASINLYPNPTSGLFNIESPEKIEELTVVNHLGQVVLSKKNINAKSIQVDLSVADTGLYLVKYYVINGNTGVTKLVIE